MEGEFFIPMKISDGTTVQMEVRQKNMHGKRRKVKTWTAQEDTILLRLYEEHPKKWSTIAALMHDRNQNQCLHRYRRLSQLGANRKIWSSEEDETIKRLIKKVGKNWKLLSETLGTKTGKQIRQRFINKLDPKIKKEEWSDEEDRKLIELYSELGSKWSEISKRIPGRPQNKIKNRFYSFIQKNYDIKYKVMDGQNTTPLKYSYQRQQKIKQEELPQEQREKNCDDFQHTGEGFMLRQDFPSLNELKLEIECDNMDGNRQSNFNSRIYLRSLIKIEDQWGLNNNRYRSIHDITSQHQIGHDHDLLYLSHH